MDKEFKNTKTGEEEMKYNNKKGGKDTKETGKGKQNRGTKGKKKKGKRKREENTVLNKQHT